jgi:hypothetical protein
MTKIRNLTNSPYDIQGHRLPAWGEIEADITDEYLSLLEASNAVEIVTVADDPLGEWRKMYHDLTGKEPDGRWSEKRLIEEIEKHGAE